MIEKKFPNKQIKYAILLSLTLLCCACETLASQNSQQIAQTEVSTSRGQILPITAQATIKDTIIDLEVAQTPQQQAMGLMFREALPDNRGMFFPFEQARITRFWMNNVPVALDMIFIKKGKVVAIANSVPPCKTKPQDCPLYGPDTMVDGVIELRSQRAEELGLAVGDSIFIKYLDISQQK